MRNKKLSDIEWSVTAYMTGNVDMISTETARAIARLYQSPGPMDVGITKFSHGLAVTPEELTDSVDANIREFEPRIKSDDSALTDVQLLNALRDYANAGHVDYPHEPGTLYDCPACEMSGELDAD